MEIEKIEKIKAIETRTKNKKTGAKSYLLGGAKFNASFGSQKLC